MVQLLRQFFMFVCVKADLHGQAQHTHGADQQADHLHVDVRPRVGHPRLGQQGHLAEQRDDARSNTWHGKGWNEWKEENGVGHSQQSERGSEDLASCSSETTSYLNLKQSAALDKQRIRLFEAGNGILRLCSFCATEASSGQHVILDSNQCRVCVRFENQLISHQLLRCYDDLQRLTVERVCGRVKVVRHRHEHPLDLCCPARGPDLHAGGDDFNILEIAVCNSNIWQPNEFPCIICRVAGILLANR
mmetsp:Transcript_725/g.1013  ORF Transcript_725/g.1013 Transcript_725/m.1013 type:complete len:247 (-) Transcript_725:219-959(-)